MGNQKLPKIVGLTPADRKEIQKVFKCSNAVVSYALSGARDNDKSLRIRKYAMDKYGAIEFVAKPKEIKILK